MPHANLSFEAGTPTGDKMRSLTIPQELDDSMTEDQAGSNSAEV